MPDWLDLELSEALRPAEAPSELWPRVVGQVSDLPRRRCPLSAAWQIAAMLFLLIAAGALWFAAKGAETPARPQIAAVRTLRPPAVQNLRAEPSCALCHTAL